MKIKQLGATIVFLAGSGWALAQSTPAGDVAAPDAKPAVAQTPASAAVAPSSPAAGCNGLEGSGQNHKYKQYNPYEEVPYGLDSRLYGSVELILWWQKQTTIPTLINTGTAPTDGKDQTDFGVRPGGRTTLGFFIDPVQECGFEATYLFLGEGTSTYSVFSDANGLPGIPRSRTITTFDLLGNPTQFTVPVSQPGFYAGSATQVFDTSVWGMEANARFRCCSLFADRTYFLAGFRTFQLNEGVQVSDVSTVLPTFTGQNLFPGDTIRAIDTFTTHNQFYGAQIGGASEFYCGKCSLDFIYKMAFGAVHQDTRITGTTVYQPVGGPATVTPTGSVATPANIGQYQRDIFAWLPEVTINAGYQFHPNLKGYIGYNYLFLSDAIRAGNLSGGPFNFNPKNYFAQGFNVGLQVRY